jgi:hypothetical protein
MDVCFGLSLDAGGEFGVVGAENSVTSCDLRIFVDQATEPIAAQNPDICAQSGRTRTPGRRALFQCPVGTARVAVIDVLIKNQPQVPLAGDQHPVRALAAGAGNPAFRDRIRTGRPDRRPDNPDPGRREHRAERRGEPGIPVPDQELDAVRVILEVHQQVTGLLRHPLPRRMRGDPGQVVGFQNSATSPDLVF